MNKDKIKISLNQEDVQNIIDCYEKDIKYIERLEKENAELKKQLEYLRSGEYLNQLKEEELFEIITDEVTKKDLLQILAKGDKE